MDNQRLLSGLKKWFTQKHLLNFAFYAALLALFFIPSAKALVIRGLMDVGFFQPEIPGAIKQSMAVAEITFINGKGKQVSLSSLKGKVVFINFWATWCPPCIAELPRSMRFINSYQQIPALFSWLLMLTGISINRSRSWQGITMTCHYTKQRRLCRRLSWATLSRQRLSSTSRGSWFFGMRVQQITPIKSLLLTLKRCQQNSVYTKRTLG